jgi:asparagine synthase (glutamine-hydrolysing)
MCGIFTIVNSDDNINNDCDTIERAFYNGQSRGPEFSDLNNYDNLCIGFHRLAINGLNDKSNQPFEIDNVVMVCNGEIYNFKQLALENSIKLTTDSDCEIIIHLYLMYGIEYTLTLLDGVFAIIIYDKNNNKLIAARDPYGVRPLYYYIENRTISFASELKVLYSLAFNKRKINHFEPGNFMIFNEINNRVVNYNYKKYTSFPCSNIKYTSDSSVSLQIEIMDHIQDAVVKRVSGTTERPVGCLLSGGLDSSLIAALVNKYYESELPLETFSIGLPESEDLKYASVVAKHLGTKHHEIIVSEKEFFDAIPEVIRVIESYDTTTIRASVGNYLLGKYISENTDCKVIFNGDGADELMGGYLYFKKAPNAFEFDRECKRLLQDIHMFDVLRSDRCIASHGLEPRTPFLDKTWVEFYLTIDRDLRYNTTKEKCEKYLLRNTVHTLAYELLPTEILWRTKEAFSDGVSSLTKSWFEIIRDNITDMFKESSNRNLECELNAIIAKYQTREHSINKPITYEQAYYRKWYSKFYPCTDHLIPYFWMPKYVDAKDSSARTLNIYSDDNTNKR